MSNFSEVHSDMAREREIDQEAKQNAEYLGVLHQRNDLLAALREIAKGAPDEDPGDILWDSMEDAYSHGVVSTHFDLAQIARAAITKATGQP